MIDNGTSIAEVDNDFKGTSNYTYDAIGNLISDSGEKIEKIEWTLSGKVKRVVFADKPTLEFVYDPLGNRVAKIKKPSAVPTSWEYTYYSKDASGNTLAVYERKTTVANTATPYASDNNTDILRPTEYPLYGSSRLGNYMPQFANQTSAVYTLQADNVRNYNAPYYTNNTKNTHLNERNYELTDHLGNVSATLSDYKTNKQAQILSAHVYYPFGMEMETRSLGKYRYGFNGKEKDDETGLINYKYRMMDPSIGRFFAVDPIAAQYPELTPYQCASNNPVWLLEYEGLEGILPMEASDQSLLKVTKTGQADWMRAVNITASPGYGLSVNVNWNPTGNKNFYALHSPARAADISRMAMIIDRRSDPVLFRNIPTRDENNTIAGQFRNLLGDQGKSDRTTPNIQYSDAFQHMLIQGLVTSIYGADVAKDFGDAFEVGRDGAFGETANPGFESYQDLVNNALGRYYVGQYSGDLTTMEGFVGYLNFVSEKVVNIGKTERRNNELEGAQVQFTADTPGVQDLFDEFNRIRTDNSEE